MQGTGALLARRFLLCQKFGRREPATTPCQGEAPPLRAVAIKF